jgi:hypothetical protein
MQILIGKKGLLLPGESFKYESTNSGKTFVFKFREKRKGHFSESGSLRKLEKQAIEG